jgi:hypothetical protein
MIDFQSSAIAKSASYRSCHSPSPGEKGRDEGELSRCSGREPAPIKVGRVSPLTAAVRACGESILSIPSTFRSIATEDGSVVKIFCNIPFKAIKGH